MRKATGGLGANAEGLAQKNRKREDSVAFRSEPGRGKLASESEFTTLYVLHGI